MQSYGNDKVDTFTSHFHPSMLEDPWQELIQRQNALRQSEILSRKAATAQAEADKEHNTSDESADDDESEAYDELNKTMT